MFAYAEEADQMIDNDLPIMRLSLLSIVSIAVGSQPATHPRTGWRANTLPAH